ncbi:hypothetical protein PGB34_02355 [Xenophilus arseniciresistens]|uniref:Uncharacterized protein n=1 Tax=Xenophilus arseniciresistens TaxID=1283306 RepID=A0AAE3N6D7_9BURK|nr:hypothetical protein [Xenophilus arseniciresistens]MDA7415196.1 hypothetical protein [Xenophilus arseniciresistens]
MTHSPVTGLDGRREAAAIFSPEEEKRFPPDGWQEIATRIAVTEALVEAWLWFRLHACAKQANADYAAATQEANPKKQSPAAASLRILNRRFSEYGIKPLLLTGYIDGLECAPACSS